MQKRAADFRRRFGHENARVWLAPHQHRQRADVIEMRVRKNDRVERPIAERAEVRERFFPLLFRVHSAIEDEALPAGFEVITVGADLRAPGQINELQQREDERAGLTRAIANLGTAHSHCSKMRIQFRNRMASISSSAKPRSMSLRVRVRLCEWFASSGTK